MFSDVFSVYEKSAGVCNAGLVLSVCLRGTYFTYYIYFTCSQTTFSISICNPSIANSLLSSILTASLVTLLNQVRPRHWVTRWVALLDVDWRTCTLTRHAILLCQLFMTVCFLDTPLWPQFTPTQLMPKTLLTIPIDSQHPSASPCANRMPSIVAKHATDPKKKNFMEKLLFTEKLLYSGPTMHSNFANPHSNLKPALLKPYTIL